MCQKGIPHPDSPQDENIPKPEAMFFDVHSGKDGGDGFEDEFGENSEILSTSDLCVRIVAGSRRSKWYDISYLSFRDSNNKTLRFNLSENSTITPRRRGSQTSVFLCKSLHVPLSY